MGQKKPIKLKKKVVEVEEEFNWDIETEEPDEEIDFFAGLADESGVNKIEGKAGRNGKRTVQVTLEYNPGELDINGMLMEVATARDTIPADWDLVRWDKYLHTVGNVPFYVLATSKRNDEYMKCIYAAALMTLNPDFVGESLGQLKAIQSGYSPQKEQDKQGRTWGGVEPIDMRRPDTVKTQVSDKARVLLESTRLDARESPAKLGAEPEDEYLKKWRMAEKRASQPRDSWEGKCDPEFEAMIKYCYGWLEDIGEVPQPYPLGSLELFWQRPRPDETPMDELTVARRTYITGLIMKLWQKVMVDKEQTAHMVFTKPLSYRVVLAAKKLTKHIENYAVSWQTDDTGDQDIGLRKRVKKYAIKYVEAHIPADQLGGKPGPYATLDPSYEDYVRLCRKYNLREGVLLHEDNSL